MKTFGEIIRKKRESEGFFLRQVAAAIDIDQAIISKFEKGERKPSRDQVLKFAKFYKLEANDLIVAWLSDKVVYELRGEAMANEALKAAEQKINYKKTKSGKTQPFRRKIHE
jgi:transcriptional regulator with XRE-family HTH domain